MHHHLFACLICCTVAFPTALSNNTQATPANLLWYAKPAPLTGIYAVAGSELDERHGYKGDSWSSEALPIGNGRLGAMVFGGVNRERLALNEISLWSGGRVNTPAYRYGPESGENEFGSYQPFGDLLIDTPYQGPDVEKGSYIRSLSLEEGIARVSFARNGVTHMRDMFASYPDQVLVVRLSASKPGAVNATFRLMPAHHARVSVSQQDASLDGYPSISMNGQLKNGLRFGASMIAITRGGTVTSSETKTDVNVTYSQGRPVADPGSLPYVSVSGADECIILISMSTDYIMDGKRHWKSGKPPEETNRKILNAAAGQGYATLLGNHNRDYTALFRRCRINLGDTDPSRSALPTDERIASYQNTPVDPGLEETLFQFGRYMIMSSSRPGSLPANLQGLWNDNASPPWASDYHSNINLQMNYWGVEPANLPECHEPFIDFLKGMEPPSREATRQEFKTASGAPVRGWTVRTSQNIFGGQSWEWNIPGSAWYARHLWEHYAFNGDRNYLKETAYPIMKEICHFWEDHLKELGEDGAGFYSAETIDRNELKGIRKGTLVAPNGWSPEHGPREDGISHDQQLVWELFNNTIAAASVLNIDRQWARELTEKRDRLAKPAIGKLGNLKEWMIDRLPKTDHRHTSHLYAVYPGYQINVNNTPEWAEAARKSLEWRGTSGDSRRSWTWPWRAALWARFKDGDKAHGMIRGFIRHNLLPNMLATHPPMQLDGTLGMTGAMAEMLVQSHAGTVELLPALPSAWSSGSAAGLKARGNITVDMEWKDGKVTRFTLWSPSPVRVKVNVNGCLQEVTTQRLSSRNASPPKSA